MEVEVMVIRERMVFFAALWGGAGKGVLEWRVAIAMNGMLSWR